MDKKKKQLLLKKLGHAEERLDHVATGRASSDIGTIVVVCSQLADVLRELVQEVSEAKATAEMCDAVLCRTMDG